MFGLHKGDGVLTVGRLRPKVSVGFLYPNLVEYQRCCVPVRSSRRHCLSRGDNLALELYHRDVTDGAVWYATSSRRCGFQGPWQARSVKPRDRGFRGESPLNILILVVRECGQGLILGYDRSFPVPLPMVQDTIVSCRVFSATPSRESAS